jgi:4-amino-4-deoxy-L-arabinose transferase-like glycosyltransferase
VESTDARGTRRFLVLLVAFVLARSYHVTRLPIFIDEAVHLFWSVRMREEPSFLRPFWDGKGLLAVVTAVTTWGASDPLLAGRLTSVAVGALGMWAAWRIGTRLFGPMTGDAAAVLYLVSPFALFYDRMVLADVYLSTLTALSLLASLRLVAVPGLRPALWLGLALGACVWARAPGLMVAAVPLLVSLLWSPRPRGTWRALAVAWAVAAAVAAFPAWQFFPQHNYVRWVAGEDVERTKRFAENAGEAAAWLTTYWTIPVVVAALGTLVAGLARRRRGEVLLGALSLGPVLAFAAVSSSLYPRYVFLGTVPFLVLAAQGLVWLAGAGCRLLDVRERLRPVATAVVVVAASVPALAFDVRLLADPASAPLPEIERFQYVDGFPSGYGSDEAARHLRAALRQNPAGVTVVADYEGRRTPFLALRALFLGEPRVEVMALELDKADHLGLLRERAAQRPTFLVTGVKVPSADRYRALGLPVALVATLQKPNGSFAGELFRVMGTSVPH